MIKNEQSARVEKQVLYAAAQGMRAVYLYAARQGDEGSIYAARQGMRACNNNNMRSPSLHLFYYGVTHVIIVLLHIKDTALIPCVAAYSTCFSTF